MNEHRVFGPPGTGKTTYLVRQIQRAVEAHGRDSLLVASFTRTAAAEIASRAGLKGYQNAGTLHALAFRQLGSPEIAETKVKDWNRWSKEHGFPSLEMGDDREASMDEPEWGQTMKAQGDQLMARVQKLRAMMIPPEGWPTQVREFFRLWTQWKDEAGLLDFTDLIEKALELKALPPGMPRVGLFDETQDFTRLELSLIRMWATQLEHVILAGDDDQCLYTFKGATPDAFLSPPVPDDHKRVLSVSHRVPRAIHALADSWIRQVAVREPKEYKPTDREGGISVLPGATWKHPEKLVAEIEAQLAEGQSVMVLGACSYMLAPLIAVLRSQGIPFHNPYRVRRGDWNPLQVGGQKTSAADRILAYLRPRPDVWPAPEARWWTHRELWKWAEHLEAGKVFRRGGKTEIENQSSFQGESLVESGFLERVIDMNVATAPDQKFPGGAFSLDPEWFAAHVMASKRKPYEFPMTITRKYGAARLKDVPQLIVGTIHSVKGGEADVVYLFPDLSPEGMREWVAKSKRDPIVRMFYVGMTRARERLVLCGHSTPCSIQWPKVEQPDLSGVPF